MKKALLCIFCLLGSFGYAKKLKKAPEDPNRTTIACSAYSDGGFFGGGTWLYLQPTQTDGDLEIGTLITLTAIPSNLTAHLQQLDPSHQNAFSLDFGYRFPKSAFDLKGEYFYFKGDESRSFALSSVNQIIQNFLGASYSTGEGSGKHRVHQADLTSSAEISIDDQLDFKPYFGARFADVKRDFDVLFTDLVLNPFPSRLEGSLESHYWGLGPLLGSHFSIPTSSRLKLRGHLGAAALFGHISSNTSSESVRENTQTFNASDDRFRVVPVIDCDVGLIYTQPFYKNKFAFELSAGFVTNYYFSAIDRINPFNGYVNNPSTFPVRVTSNLGFSGPYVKLSFLENPLPFCCGIFSETRKPDIDFLSGFFLRMTNAWIKPTATNNDTTFATLVTPSGSSGQAAEPGFIWSGTYELSYRLRWDIDFIGKYFRYRTTDDTSVAAGAGEGILSINASGPAAVLFSNADSKVRYKIDQYDLLSGKYMQLGTPFNLHTFLGLRYVDLRRMLRNDYLGGVPGDVTTAKTPFLESQLRALGLLFGFQPQITLVDNLRIVGLFDLGFLVGKIQPKLDQVNFGTGGNSSNNLRVPKTNTTVPVVDAKAGLAYTFELPSKLALAIEGGYEFKGYYRGVNLVLPVFLTGLQQLNSDLLLTGPYFTVTFGGFF